MIAGLLTSGIARYAIPAILTIGLSSISSIANYFKTDYKAEAKELTTKLEATQQAKDADQASYELMLAMAKSLAQVQRDQDKTMLILEETLLKTLMKEGTPCPKNCVLP